MIELHLHSPLRKWYCRTVPIYQPCKLVVIVVVDAATGWPGKARKAGGNGEYLRCLSDPQSLKVLLGF